MRKKIDNHCLSIVTSVYIPTQGNETNQNDQQIFPEGSQNRLSASYPLLRSSTKKNYQRNCEQKIDLYF